MVNISGLFKKEKNIQNYWIILHLYTGRGIGRCQQLEGVEGGTGTNYDVVFEHFKVCNFRLGSSTSCPPPPLPNPIIGLQIEDFVIYLFWH